MTDDDYRELMETLQAAARTWSLMLCGVTDDDLTVAAETVERADSFGAILDPTKYRERLQDGGLDRQRKLIASARAFRKALRETFPTDLVLKAIPLGEEAR